MKKSAIIFGGNGGVGKIISDHLAKLGLQITISARSVTHKEAPDVLHVPCDLNSIKSIESLFSTHKKHFKSAPCIIVNASAIQGPIGPIWEISEEDWKSAIDVDLNGVFRITKVAINEMASGSIIHFGGGGAVFARPNFTAYACAKTAVLRFVENVDEELIQNNKHSITINAIAPGAVKTQMTQDILNAGVAATTKGIKEAEEVMKTGGTPPHKITNLIDFLIEENKKNRISGKLIHVNEPYSNLKDTSENISHDLGKLRRIPL